MATLGRPKTHGGKPGWMLLRAAIVIAAFTRARHAGQKHMWAIQAAINAVIDQFPGMPISKAEVKRILTEFQPQDAEQALVVINENDPRTLGFAARPTYPKRKR